jgi:drug/metabolite transporter (DMT)-like permease
MRLALLTAGYFVALTVHEYFQELLWSGVSSEGEPLPASMSVVVTLVQFLGCGFLSLSLLEPGEHLLPRGRDHRRALVPFSSRWLRFWRPYAAVSGVVFLSTALSNQAARFVFYTVKIVFRAGKLLPTMIVAGWIGNSEPFGVADYGAAALVSAALAGFALASAGGGSATGASAGGGDGPGGDGPGGAAPRTAFIDGERGGGALAVGVCLLTLSGLCEAFAPNLQQAVMRGRPLPSIFGTGGGPRGIFGTKGAACCSQPSHAGSQGKAPRGGAARVAPAPLSPSASTSSRQRRAATSAQRPSPLEPRDRVGSQGDLESRAVGPARGSPLARSGRAASFETPAPVSSEVLLARVNLCTGAPLILASLLPSLPEVADFTSRRPLTLAPLVGIGVSLAAGAVCYTRMIRESGSVFAVVASSARKLLSIALSFVLFPKPLSWAHGACAGLLAAGIALGWWAKRRRRSAGEPLLPKGRRDEGIGQARVN